MTQILLHKIDNLVILCSLNINVGLSVVHYESLRERTGSQFFVTFQRQFGINVSVFFHCISKYNLFSLMIFSLSLISLFNLNNIGNVRDNLVTWTLQHYKTRQFVQNKQVKKSITSLTGNQKANVKNLLSLKKKTLFKTH